MRDKDSYSNFKGCVSNEEISVRTNGVCGHCGVDYNLDTHQAHMLLPKRLGGKYVADNCIMLCDRCFDRYNDTLLLRLDIEFPNMTPNSVIRSMGYIESELNSLNIDLGTDTEVVTEA